MKRLLLLSFSVAAIICVLHQKSETHTNPNHIEGLVSPAPVDEARPVSEADLRAASEKAIKLIQHSQVEWSKRESCTSCHHQLLPEIPINLARERGVSLDEKIARKTTAAAFEYFKDLDGAVQGYDYIDALFDGWSLTAAQIAGISPSLATAAYAQSIASHQIPDGSWHTIDVRPPQAHSQFATTAVCAQALQYYMPEQLKHEKELRVGQAREWLLKTQPKTTEDRAFQLLGLHWTGADEDSRKKAASKLLNEQHADGGWSQLPSRSSDAYATGEVLVALRQTAGFPTREPAYQRGLRFLLKTQEPDGSWHVRSRLHPPAPVSPPYFETGFPYQHDQFISAMGTAWAAAALLHAIPLQTGSEAKRFASPVVAPAENAEWINVALNGSATDLKKLLNAGMKADAKTAAGTTALMLAARDPEKVKLLIERGADVNARSTAGITPLMVASRYRGNSEVVGLLLKRGAKPTADKGVEVRYDASALFFAVMAGDAQIVGVLLDAGARPGDRMKLLGRFAISPLLYATFDYDSSVIERLISKGASPNEVDDDKISALGWATIANDVSVVQALVARGAQVNHVDRFGMTPLLYAASIDFGDTAVMEKLIGAGADLNAKNKEGLTALDLARSYQHAVMMSLLAKKTASR